MCVAIGAWFDFERPRNALQSSRVNDQGSVFAALFTTSERRKMIREARETRSELKLARARSLGGIAGRTAIRQLLRRCVLNAELRRKRMANFHVVSGASERPAHVAIRKIGIDDIKFALRKGWEDFMAFPTQAVFVVLIYPIMGLVLGRLAVGSAVLPLVFPLVMGFALIGPIAAVGLYEMSRRREAGLDTQWYHVFDVFKSPSIGAIAALGVVLMILLLAWLYTAQAIYQSLFGLNAPDDIGTFLQEVFTTQAGWKLIVYGNIAGFCFALASFLIGAVSFPLLLDRDVGAAAAVATSVRAVIDNPVTMAIWGVIVAALLVIGSIPFFVGLAVVMPLLGHATWHLYRRIVAPDV
jgi:uncharacterized membrane protein